MTNTESITGYLTGAQNFTEAFCGHVAYYEVTESTKIPHDQFVDRLTQLDLGSYIPDPPRDDDAFSRVTSAVQRKREPVPGRTDQFANYLVRKVRHSKGDIVKQIVIEIVDGQNKRLTFTPAIEMQFSAQGSRFSVTPLIDTGDPGEQQAWALAMEARSQFFAWRGHLNSDAIRRFINRVIVGSQATILKAGLYFIPTPRMELVERMQQAVSGINGVVVHTIPLVDTEDQRAMVRRAFQTETVGHAQKLTAQIHEMINSGNVDGVAATRLQEEIATLAEKASEYQHLLEGSLGGTELHMASLEAARRKLVWHATT